MYKHNQVQRLKTLAVSFGFLIKAYILTTSLSLYLFNSNPFHLSSSLLDLSSSLLVNEKLVFSPVRGRPPPSTVVRRNGSSPSEASIHRVGSILIDDEQQHSRDERYHVDDRNKHELDEFIR